MAYFNTPATYKTEGSVIYPTSHQEYKQKQKSTYGRFDSMEYSSGLEYSNTIPENSISFSSNTSSLPKGQYKPNSYLSSWGSAQNNVIQFNPSIVNDGMVMYYSKNNYRQPYNAESRSYNSTSMTHDGKYSDKSKRIANMEANSRAYITDSGRRIEMIPETLNSIIVSTNKSRTSAFPHLDGNYFATAPDFTDIDSKHSQKTASEYFNKHNQFQTHDFTSPGTKTIKLESGRVITFDVKPDMKEISRCPRPEDNNLEITPNKHAYNVDSEYPFPLSGLSGANIPDNMYLRSTPATSYEIQQQLKSDIPQKEQSLQLPKSLVPTNEIETVRKNVPSSIAHYMAGYSQGLHSESFNPDSKLHSQNVKSEQFFEKTDMADELYKQVLRTRAISVCYFLLNFKAYKPWMKHWKILDDNLKKTNLNISKLPINDKEIAFTLDKGEVIKFRWEDEKRFIPIDVYMYVLLHELTHESFPPSFQGHGDPFPQMLCLLCVAATEVGILDIQNIPKNIFMSNGRPITSRESIKTEIMFGIDMLMEANKNDPEIIEYYNAKREYVNKYS